MPAEDGAFPMVEAGASARRTLRGQGGAALGRMGGL